MKNFGFRNLRFVQPPRNYKDAEARKMSVGAFDILKESRVFETLDQALEDISVAIGTTSGQQREQPPLPLDTVVDRICTDAVMNRVAIIFGDERDGLKRNELERCHYTITIPTDEGFPALNVAQAVAVIAYDLSRQFRLNTQGPISSEKFPVGKEDDELFSQLGDLLDRVEFSRTFNRKNVLSEIRQFYHRARPTERELDLLKGALHRIRQKLKEE